MKALVLILSVFFSLLFPISVLAAQAQLSFQTQYLELEVDEEARGEIQLATNGEDIIGVDLSLRYEQDVIEIVEVKSTGVFTHDKIDVGEGILSVHLFNDFENAFKGSEDIVSIRFKAKAVASPTAITFDFIGSKSRDTNVVNVVGKDVLGKVNALTLHITEKPVTEIDFSEAESQLDTQVAVNTMPEQNAPTQNTPNLIQNISVAPQVLYFSALVGVVVVSGGVYVLMTKS